MPQAKTISIPAPIIERTFEISENIAPDIVGRKLGQALQMIISYEVIERTKSFAVLRVNSISLKPARRVF